MSYSPTSDSIKPSTIGHTQKAREFGKYVQKLTTDTFFCHMLLKICLITTVIYFKFLVNTGIQIPINTFRVSLMKFYSRKIHKKEQIILQIWDLHFTVRIIVFHKIMLCLFLEVKHNSKR